MTSADRPTRSPTRGRSLLAPALTAASASDRPVLVVTDGEIEDAADILPTFCGRLACSTFSSRRPSLGLALDARELPGRVTAGDTIPLELEVEATGGAAADSVAIEATLGGKRVGIRRLALRNGSARGRLTVSSERSDPAST